MNTTGAARATSLFYSLAALFLSLCLVACLEWPASPPDVRELRVTAVLDGDTLEVLETPPGETPRTLRLRLVSVDCPERSQPFGRVAREFTAREVFGAEIRATLVGNDRYGRELAWVSRPGDTTTLNHRLIEAGLAWHYRRYSDDPTLERLEREARAARRGLWADPNPVAPWDFRREETSR